MKALITTGLLALTSVIHAQTGSIDEPFTKLGQAQTVTAAGIYHFDLGEPFATYVDANGYVQVALDFGNGPGFLPTRDTLAPTAPGILSTAALATLTSIAEIRISCDVPNSLDATTTDATLIERVRTKQTLFHDHLDNDFNNNWTGTGAAYLTADADPLEGTRPELGLAGEVYHTFYNTSGLHWIPERPEQGLGHLNNIPAGNKLVLWVRAADYIPTAGTSYLPFTSLAAAATVRTGGVYYFDLDGTTFRTYVDTAGYVQVALDYGQETGILPQSTALPRSARGILSPAVLAKLSDITEVRMSASDGTLDAATINPTIAQHIRDNRALMSGQADNAANNDWVGTGANHLTADATQPRAALPLQEEIFHGYFSDGGMHWIPFRGDQALTHSNDVAAGIIYTLWVYGGCEKKTDPPTVDLSTYTIAACDWAGGTAVVPPPSATDVCGLAVPGTTSDPVEFTAAGSYTINWSFTDGYGRTTVASETIVVESDVLTPPLYESVEPGSISLGCWTLLAGTNDGEGTWTINGSIGGAAGSATAFYLPPAAAGVTQADFLMTPKVQLVAGQDYRLTFNVRANATENLYVGVYRAADYTFIKRLTYDAAVANSYDPLSLTFRVPTDDVYHLGFLSSSEGGRQGLAVDEIKLEAYQPPTTGGAALLAGQETDNCLTGYARGVSGEAWIRVGNVNDPDRLLLEINPNGNTLGDVTVQLTDYANAPTAPYTGLPHIGRHVDIIPEAGSGPYTTGGGVSVRLYFRESELQEMREAYGRNLAWSDLNITHYYGPGQDCDIHNSTDGTSFELLAVQQSVDYGADAHYLEFTTTDFSEFSAYSEQGLPVTLHEFTARREGAANLLQWEVASESDFSHYLVERAGVAGDFTELTTVPATASERYFTRDPAPFGLSYYRLKLVDLDGSFVYGPVESVQRAAAEEVSVYPVPAGDQASLRLVSASAERVELQLIDALGRCVYRRVFRTVVGEQAIPLDISDLPPATYRAVVVSEDGVRTVSLIRR